MEHDTMEGCYEGGSSLHPGKMNPSCLQLEILILLFCQRISRSRDHEILQPGRCFAAVWIEPGGPSLRDDDKHVTKVEYNQYAYTKPSRFMSVRNQKGFCVALRIHTFGGRGEEKYITRLAHLFHVRSTDDSSDLSHLDNKISIDQS